MGGGGFELVTFASLGWSDNFECAMLSCSCYAYNKRKSKGKKRKKKKEKKKRREIIHNGREGDPLFRPLG